MLARAWLTLMVSVGVVLVISGGFYVGYVTLRPHTARPAQVLTLFWGFMSALVWGLSIVGSLVWRDLGLASSTGWNSWFNFFAAGFASLAVGYATP